MESQLDSVPEKPLVFTSIDRTNKVSESEKHVFFLNGPFSQWHPSNFEYELEADGPKLQFNCAEQYMMAGKAHLFGDMDSLAKIMAIQQERDWREAPKKHKALGRLVKGFDIEVWEENAEDIVYRGNWAKFSQNRDLADVLVATMGKRLVEGAHYDPVWGVGLAWDDPAILDPKNWKGKNKLGKTLEAVRAHVHCQNTGMKFSVDPWMDVSNMVLDTRDPKNIRYIRLPT